MKIRTRFAPSPTGEMHIGNLRAAIFNWILARQCGGEFYLRIEDTDYIRSNTIYEKKIFQILEWMRLDFDLFENKIVKQSERINIYQEIAKNIPNTYFCICEERTNCNCYNMNYKKGTLRFFVKKDQNLHFRDMVFGDLKSCSNQIEDFALLRTNGIPTYNLAVVVDDHLMNISHVVRGEDHKTNTFKQIMIYEAMQWQIPSFAHLPIIKGSDGKKLSKRERSSSVYQIYEDGICSSALFNILLKMGWGYGNEEIISRERALEIFKISNIKRSSAVFETKKLYNFSKKYMIQSKKEAQEFLQNFYGLINEKVFDYFFDEISSKCQTYRDIINVAPFVLQDTLTYPDVIRTSFDIIKGKTIEEQKKIRFEVTGAENGLSIESLWNYYNSTDIGSISSTNSLSL